MIVTSNRFFDKQATLFIKFDPSTRTVSWAPTKDRHKGQYVIEIKATVN